MKERWSWVGGALLVAALAFACGDEDEAEGFGDEVLVHLHAGELHIDIRSAPQPPRSGLADIEMIVRGEGGAPVSGLSIRVIPWMGEHGHGSNEVDASEVEAGRYVAEGVLFSMPGNWELVLEIGGSVEGSWETASFQVLP